MQTIEAELGRQKNKAYGKVTQARVKPEKQSTRGKQNPKGPGKNSKKKARFMNNDSKIHEE